MLEKYHGIPGSNMLDVSLEGQSKSDYLNMTEDGLAEDPSNPEEIVLELEPRLDLPE